MQNDEEGRGNLTAISDASSYVTLPSRHTFKEELSDMIVWLHMIVKYLWAKRGLETHCFQIVPLAQVLRDINSVIQYQYNISILMIPCNK